MTTTIDRNWLEANGNEKANDSAFQRLLDYENTSNGVFRSLQAVQKTAKLGNQIVKEAGSIPSAMSTGLATNLGIATSAMGLARLPAVTSQAIQSISAVGDDKNTTDLSRKVKNAVRDTGEAVAIGGYATLFVTGSPAAQTVAQIADMTSDVADFDLAISDYRKAAELETMATGDVKKAVTHSKNFHFLRIAKIVASIATVVLGAILVAKGVPLLALMMLSLVTTLLAITKDIYKTMGQHKVITFDRNVTLVNSSI